jgi:hypothetical protein
LKPDAVEEEPAPPWSAEGCCPGFTGDGSVPVWRPQYCLARRGDAQSDRDRDAFSWFSDVRARPFVEGDAGLRQWHQAAQAMGHA